MANARDLARRDPQLAGLFGLLGSTGAASFGAERGSKGASFGADDFGDGFGADDFGDGFGADDMGADDFGAANPMVQAKAMAAYKANIVARKRGAARARMLDPNAGSSVKTERYIFAISDKLIVVGTAKTLDLTDSPDTKFRPQRVTANAFTPMLAFITDLKMANVSVSIGGGDIDAYQWNANGQGQELDMPTLEPSNKARALGDWTDFIPAPLTLGQKTRFSLSFTGPSRLAG